jgi:hypothetical protein
VTQEFKKSLKGVPDVKIIDFWVDAMMTNSLVVFTNISEEHITIIFNDIHL